MNERVERLRRSLADCPDAGAAVLITSEVDVRHLTGFTGDSTFLLVAPESMTLLSDGRFETQIVDECPGFDGNDPRCEVAIRPPTMKMPVLVAGCVGGRFDRLVVDPSTLTLAMYRSLQSAMPDVTLVERGGWVARQRMIKDADEVRDIAMAVRIAESTINDLMIRGHDWVYMSERELSWAIERGIRSLGGEGVSFETIVAADAAAALPHYRPGDTPLKDAAVILIDWGARLDGYVSDLTRTFHNPRRIDDDYPAAYAATLAAHDAAVAAIRPGATAAEIDAAARDVLVDAGLGDAFKHSTGHGIGREVHEGPRLGGGVETELRPGMVVTVEPGVYHAGRWGIRIENDVLVTETGHQVLSDGLPTAMEAMRIGG